MLHNTQERSIEEMNTAGQKPAALHPDERLFNAAELRLFRYTAVLSSLVALTALIGIIGWAFGWILNVFFTLLSGNALRGKTSELLSVFHKPTQKKALYFMDVFIGYVTAFFQGQLIIAVCMGILYALSFTLIGLEFGVLVGLVMGYRVRRHYRHGTRGSPDSVLRRHLERNQGEPETFVKQPGSRL